QAPLQPVNLESVPGAALSVTCVPEERDAVQMAPQSMPPAPPTCPEPEPFLLTVSVNKGRPNACKLPAVSATSTSSPAKAGGESPAPSREADQSTWPSLAASA